MNRILNPATGNMILRTSPLGRRLVKIEQASQQRPAVAATKVPHEVVVVKPPPPPPTDHNHAPFSNITCFPATAMERVELEKQIDANKFHKLGYDWAPWCLNSVMLTYVVEKVHDCDTLLIARDHQTNEIKGFACVESAEKYLMIDLICAQNSGTLIMNTIIEMGTRLKKQFIYLEAVNTAVLFYQKLGFLNKLLDESLNDDRCHQQNKLIAQLSADVAALRKRLASKRMQTMARNKLIKELKKQKLTKDEGGVEPLYPMVKCI